ncbi:MAG: hypothetical protein U9N53_06530 [Bacteroidota bacterium]|nr:hypothetical protein [Bacteroidota bacterium]
MNLEPLFKKLTSSSYGVWNTDSTELEGSFATKRKLLDTISPLSLLSPEKKLPPTFSFLFDESKTGITESDIKPKIPTEYDLSINLHKIHSRPLDDFFSLQKYEGIVTEIKENSFWARLINLTNKTYDEEAEFPLEEVTEEDKKLVDLGAIFYWNIGCLVLTGGQRIGAQLIRFRRLPTWSKGEIMLSYKRADQKSKLFGWG